MEKTLKRLFPCIATGTLLSFWGLVGLFNPEEAITEIVFLAPLGWECTKEFYKLMKERGKQTLKSIV